MSFPTTGSSIQIHSYKHNGQLHRVWEETIILKGTSSVVIGGNDRIIVTESDGREWRTREPAICYFSSDQWFNVIAMLRENGIHYYCNLGTPFTYDEEALKYIDYDLDVKIFPDMTYTLLDEDEFVLHRREMDYPREINDIMRRNLDQLYSLINQRKGPFEPFFVENWYERFLEYR
ncbi:nucleoside tri-diphosphate phosphatase [Pseudalkalibacillus decolorationis]|uniref:nucleoside tri-diphosphate phosphatase n=1 Tax=Pseudalkalibacillus decolorationis TaxID=163879 RepID=UPI00214845C0|nr:DUF402 domain-containing protein [Pseudalkalibacillus decolorationis]